MKLTSTHLQDNMFFPLKGKLTEPIDINLENQTHNTAKQQTALAHIDAFDSRLTQHFHNKIKLQPALTRQLVSFQANKPRPTYRWYKYKEAFSASLIEILLSKYRITSGKVLDCTPQNLNEAFTTPSRYIALGELKGGIDPAGADEHWKTARTSLARIRKAFSTRKLSPYIFFVGAAIENSMAEEIWHQLEDRTLSNAANLTNADQVASLCGWLCSL